jgi:signal transduction histidine kinase
MHDPAHDRDPVQHGLMLRLTDMRALLPFAEELLAQGCGPRTEVYAGVFLAWGQLARGQRAAAEEALARTLARAREVGDREGLAVSRGLEADLWLRDGRLDEVLAHCDATAALGDGALPARVRYLDAARRSLALARSGRLEDGLRAHYERLALARHIAEPDVLCDALANLGGLQTSLMNLADGLTLGEEAWSLCADTAWHGLVQVAGPNLMCTLSGLGEHARACTLARQLMDAEPRFSIQHRPARRCMYAIALAAAGRHDEAQRLLDQARDERPDIAELRPEWVWTQAMVWNHQGRPADALALVAPHHARLGEAFGGGYLPEDRAQLCAQAAIACEATGDLAGALRHEREAAAAREQAGARAADARRLSLQIGHALDTARRQRDQALREQARAEQERARLAELNARLAEADAAKTRFLAAASHDLRQPVQALALTLATLQGERSASGQRRLMARMQQSLQALGSMFDVLLDVSRLDAGRVPVNLAPVDLGELLQRLVDEHAPAAGAAGLGLRLHLPRQRARGMLRALGHSDAALLEVCLRNLLGNALKYTPHGGVLLRLRVPVSGPEHGWRIEVRDTGIGIPQEAQARVFQEFYQVGNPERDRRQGLGLGLAIVERTAALLGHRVGLRSRPGRGSCFHLELAAAPGGLEDVPSTRRRAGAGPQPTLIVVDDDAEVRDALLALLRRWGHAAVAGADAAEALAAWEGLGRPRIGAALVDLRLRGGSTGLEAIAALRQALGADLPALVITGDVAAERTRQLDEAGQPWLAKPLMPLRLRSWLRGLAAD